MKSGAPRISVVIPALNEAKNLPYVFASLPKDIDDVIVVDGHSTDNTVAVARSLYPNVRASSRPKSLCLLSPRVEMSQPAQRL